MVNRETILVWGRAGKQGWTLETIETIDQAKVLAGSSRANLHLITVLSDDFCPFDGSSDDPIEDYPDVSRLWDELSANLIQDGVKLTTSLVHASNPDIVWPPGLPAPIQIAMLGIPSLQVDNSMCEVHQTLEDCRDDVWLAAQGAFERDIPCLIVYDDLGPIGEQALHNAVKTAQRLQARLLVVHASNESEELVSSNVIETAMMDRLMRTDFRTISEGTRLFVQPGEPDKVLLQAAQEFDASLMIFTWPDGPIADRDLEEFLKESIRSRCSLLLVRTHETPQLVNVK